jgi:lipopolysaccharide biosynthesis glycosyltransferase
LDADTVSMKDVSTLFSIDVEGYEMAAVPDAIGKHFFGRHYCNVGVLLMNVTQMVEDGVFAKAIKLMNTHRYPFPDQDVLNKVTKGRRLHLPREFNEQKKIRPETVIRHYCNKPFIFPYPHALIAKPWEIDRIHEIHHTTAHDALYKECDSYWGRLKK